MSMNAGIGVCYYPSMGTIPSWIVAFRHRMVPFLIHGLTVK